MPSIETSVAFSVCQVSVVDCPAFTVAGLAEMFAVGAGGGGGGGGGGAAVFFLPQPATNKSTDSATICVVCIHWVFFTYLLRKFVVPNKNDFVFERMKLVRIQVRRTQFQPSRFSSR